MSKKTLILLLTTLTVSTTPLQDPKQPTTPTTKPPHLFNSQETHSTDSSEEYWYYTDYSSEEATCTETEFWHIRGRRCVPFTCPRANWLRDWKTGECLYETASDVAEIKKFGRSAFKTRAVLKPRNQIRGRGRHVQRGWNTVYERKRVHLDDEHPNPIRTLGLIG